MVCGYCLGQNIQNNPENALCIICYSDSHRKGQRPFVEQNEKWDFEMSRSTQTALKFFANIAVLSERAKLLLLILQKLDVLKLKAIFSFFPKLLKS